MSAVTLAASIIAARPGTYKMPGALQQFLYMIDQQRWNLPASDDLCSLKADLESRWQIASFEGQTSTETLYEILQYAWKEWQRLTA